MKKNDEIVLDRSSLGALAQISEFSVRSALQTVRNGRMYHLGQVMDHDMPVHESHGTFWCNTEFDYKTSRKWMSKHFGKITNGYSDANCRISMCDHSGTHMDNLNHSVETRTGVMRAYGGWNAMKIMTSFGTSKLGAESLVPIISNGILLDVARSKNKEMLSPGYAVSISDLERCLSKEDLEVKKGDTVLVNTGWGKLWGIENARFLSGEPGLGMAAGKWLGDKGIIIIGIDNFGLDPFPYEIKGVVNPLHIHFLVRRGIRIIENMYLQGIAKDRIYNFAFICLPLRIRGATASPVMPVAVI